MQPGEKDSIASGCHIVGGTVVISLFSKIWMFIRSGGGKNYKRIHVRKLKNCFTHYHDICISVDFDFIV